MAVVIAGPFFGNFMKKIKTGEIKAAAPPEIVGDLPSVTLSFTLAIFPVFLISLATFGKSFLGLDNPYVSLVGEPVFALLLAVLMACYFLGKRRGLALPKIMGFLQDSISNIAMIMMVIAAGGGFKQVLIDSGVANEVAVSAENAGPTFTPSQLSRSPMLPTITCLMLVLATTFSKVVTKFSRSKIASAPESLS